MDILFEGLKVKRSLRDFQNAVSDLLNADAGFFSSRVERLFFLIHEDKIIKHVVSPFLNVSLDLSIIELWEESGWGRLALPVCMNDQIAYALQLLNRALKDEVSLDEFAVRIFPTDNFNEGIYMLNQNLLHPCMRELLNKINDLIEDEVENKAEIHSAALQIINIGNITTGGGDVAIGKNITQKHSQNSLKDELIDHLFKAGLSKENIDHVDAELEKLGKEVDKPQIDKPKLQHVFTEICKKGGKEILLLIKEVIRKPEIISVIDTFLT